MTALPHPHSFRALGLLLQYPEPALRDAMPELAAVLAREPLLSPSTREALATLTLQIQDKELLAQQERYSGMFDGGRFLSLHLFEHVHGDSRARGQALVDLTQVYASEGFELSQAELPDYLPLLCEFLSVAAPTKAASLLRDMGEVLAQLCQALKERRSEYAVVLDALLEFAGQPALEVVANDETTTSHSTPFDAFSQDLEALDRQWQEEPVEFGAGAAHDSSCVSQLNDRAPERDLVSLRRSKDSPAKSVTTERPL